MPRFALPVAALFVLAGCSGGSDDAAVTLPATSTTELPAQTVATTEAPPATEVPTTVAATSTTLTSTTTSTTSTIPISVVEPSTTVIPADIDETFAEAFAVYEEAWLVRREGAEDPSSESVRESVERHFVDPAKAEVINSLDEQASGPFRSVDSADREPSVVIFVEGIATVENGTFVEFKSCEVITSLAVDTTTDEVVFDAVFAYAVDVRMRKIEDDWYVSDLVNVSRTEGRECES